MAELGAIVAAFVGLAGRGLDKLFVLCFAPQWRQDTETRDTEVVTKEHDLGTRP
jgi:hypothetical protein